MKVILTKLLPIIIVINLSACGESEDDKFKAKLNNMFSKNNKAINDLSLKYKANDSWDTTFNYSSYYQKTFIGKNKFMLFKGRVYDIISYDSTSVVKLLTINDNTHRQFIALVTATPEQVSKINQGTKRNKLQLEINEEEASYYIPNINDYDKDIFAIGGFVIKVKKVISTNPSLNEEDEITYWSINKDHFIQVFKGELIDFYITENDVLDN